MILSFNKFVLEAEGASTNETPEEEEETKDPPKKKKGESTDYNTDIEDEPEEEDNVDPDDPNQLPDTNKNPEEATSDYSSNEIPGDDEKSSSNEDNPNPEEEPPPPDDEGSGTEDSEGNGDVEHDKTVQSILLLKNFIRLSKDLDMYCDKILNSDKESVMVSVVYSTVRSNLTDLSGIVYKYIIHYYDNNEYQINLYNYKYFIEILKINVEMLQKVSMMEDNRTTNK